MPKRLFCLLLVIAVSTLTAGNNPPRQSHAGTPANVIIHATDILEFNAISDGRKVYVNWASGNEKKYDYFTIEKAKDGLHFETAAMIKGGGDTDCLVDYIDIDYSPYMGISYYRIKQTDYAGEVSYSDVVSVNYQFSNDGSIVSCRDFDPIDVKEVEKKEILVVLRDAQGLEHVSKVMLSENSKTGGVYATDLKNRLNKGTYVVLASSYNRLFSQNLVVR